MSCLNGKLKLNALHRRALLGRKALWSVDEELWVGTFAQKRTRRRQLHRRIETEASPAGRDEIFTGASMRIETTSSTRILVLWLVRFWARRGIGSMCTAGCAGLRQRRSPPARSVREMAIGKPISSSSHRERNGFSSSLIRH
ncbi:hypothetical protein HID58_092065 [Brassica napus]|uniref:Uncharacterized protein n=1 Tax=Brassica napus TaxID=3708 RepID=A0ABQ7WZY1_BRANA|nr:hypothetical protein HID58_092065 [Brassica napus]